MRGNARPVSQQIGEHSGHLPPPNLMGIASSIPETQAMYDHRVKIDSVVESVRALAESFSHTNNALKRVSDTFESYSELFTDESRPEFTVALKASGKLRDFLSRVSALFAEADQDLQRMVVAEYKILTEMVFVGAEETLGSVDSAQRKYDAAKKTAAGAKKRGIQQQLMEDDAGTVDERAADDLAKARRECVAAYENACNIALLQNAHSFHGVFLSFSHMFSNGQAIVNDMEPWDQEITQQVTNLTNNAEAGALNPKEALTTMVEKEEQYNAVLAGICDLQKKLTTDPGLKFSMVEARHIFNNIGQIQAVHDDIFKKLKNIRSSGDIAKDVAALYETQFPILEKLYVPYIEQVHLSVKNFEHTKKGNGKFAKFMKAYKKKTPSIGTVPFDVPTLLVYPSHHLYKISNCMRELENQTDPNHESWIKLHQCIETLGELLETLDLAKKQSEQMKHLESLNSKLPDEKLVVGNRAYVQDGSLVVVSDTRPGGPAPPKSPLSPTTGDGASNAPLQPKQHYHLFLFNDILFIAPLPKKGEPGDVFHACCKFNVDSLKVSNVSKTSFKLEARDRTTVWEAPNADACQTWCANFERTISERGKTVVFGTPLSVIMKRPSERGRVIPSFLRRAVECVEQTGLKTEGVFRLSSEAVEFTRMCKALDAGRRPLFTDPLDAANFIKAWLRALPEPLLTNKLHDQWVSAQESGKPSLEQCVQALPVENRNVLDAVIHVLREVADNSNVNKMNASNLATLVGVGILESPSENPFSKSGVAVVEMLINRYDEAFAQMKKDALAEAAAVEAEAAAVAAAAGVGAAAPVVIAVRPGNKRASVYQLEDQNRLGKLATLRRRSCSLLPSSKAAADLMASPASPTSPSATSPPPGLSGSAGAAAAATTTGPVSPTGNGPVSPTATSGPIGRSAQTIRVSSANPPLPTGNLGGTQWKGAAARGGARPTLPPRRP